MKDYAVIKKVNDKVFLEVFQSNDLVKCQVGNCSVSAANVAVEYVNTIMSNDMKLVGIQKRQKGIFPGVKFYYQEDIFSNLQEEEDLVLKKGSFSSRVKSYLKR